MLKRVENIIRGNAVEQKKKKAGMKFNPGLALIGLRTTGPSAIPGFVTTEKKTYDLYLVRHRIVANWTSNNSAVNRLCLTLVHLLQTLSLKSITHTEQRLSTSKTCISTS